jgi:hypothetical protein
MAPQTPYRAAKIRYSPKPIESYHVGHPLAPMKSRLLTDPATWNLAYLSHDYEEQPAHHDPDFTTLVRKSSQMSLDGSGWGVGHPRETLLASWLDLPPARFMYLLIRNERLLFSLPIYQAYNLEWLKNSMHRQRLCCNGETEPDPITLDESTLHEINKAFGR